MKRLFIKTLIFTIFLIAGICTYAIDSTYKNNLLNVQLAQTPDNKVSVLLVFEKPYNDPVKVVYKAENEYNILLPETYHSVGSISTLNTLNVRSASVKLVPYFNKDDGNGYTKITLKTTRPVVFNAHASYVTDKVASADAPKKDSKAETKTITPTKVAVAPKTPAAAKKPAAVSTQQNAAQTAKTTAKTTAKAAAKTEIKQQKQETKPIKPAVKAEEPVKTASLPAVKKDEIQKVTTAKPVKPKEDVKPEPAQKAAEKTVEQQEQIAKQPETKQAPEEQLLDEPIPVTTQTTEVQNKQTSSLSALLKPLTGNTNSALIVIIIAAILMLLLLLRIFNRNAQKYSLKYNKLTQAPKKSEATTQDGINDMTTWQEKYKQMKEQEKAKVERQERERQEEISDKLDDIYGNQLEPQISAVQANTVYAETETANTDDKVDTAENNEINPIWELASEREEDMPETNYGITEPTEAQEPVSTNNIANFDTTSKTTEIDNNVPYTFTIDNEIQPAQEIEDASEPAVSDFKFEISEPATAQEADLTREFSFDEFEPKVVDNTLEETPITTQDNEIQPEEEITDFKYEIKEPIISQETTTSSIFNADELKIDNEIAETNINLQDNEIQTTPEIIEDVQPAASDMNYDIVEEPVEVQEEPVSKDSTYVSSPIEHSNEPILLNQAKISKTKGFYLIKYENQVSLMGYIKDKIFVIHSFDNNDQSFIQTRLTEKRRGADIYLVRAKNYKALVEVSKEQMRTLINL